VRACVRVLGLVKMNVKQLACNEVIMTGLRISKACNRRLSEVATNVGCIENSISIHMNNNNTEQVFVERLPA